MGKSNIDSIFSEEEANKFAGVVLHKGQCEVVGAIAGSGKDARLNVHSPAHVKTLQFVWKNCVLLIVCAVPLDVEVDGRGFDIEVTEPNSFQF